MKAGFYPRMALSAVRKNRRLYFPYLLTGSVMVMMFYILRFLTESPALASMPGGSVLMSILPLGQTVIGVFSLLFLFYTHSFLIRQRYREFGLYSILGMDKGNIGRIMLAEGFIIGALCILCGCALGIAFSKAAELILLNLLGMEISFALSVSQGALVDTALVFGGIYLLLLVNSLVRVRRSRPLELMTSSRVGEKIPKRIWLDALIGLVFIGIAYSLALSIKQPLTALSAFFIAVMLVIGGTYELFMAGSVALCRLLQKNKAYYYQPNHFVAVSSMAYRMRRNGAGLASICILLTMVLVMISSSASLYFGVEDSLHSRYPNDVNITLTMRDLDGFSEENVRALQSVVEEESDCKALSYHYRAASVAGMLTKDGITIDSSSTSPLGLISYDNIGYLYVVPLEDYNRMSGRKETLQPGECLLHATREDLSWETFAVADSPAWQVKRMLPDFFADADQDAAIVAAVYMVVGDFAAFAEPLLPLATANGNPMLVLNWFCGFNMPSTEEELAAADAVSSALRAVVDAETHDLRSSRVESREANRLDFLQTYGSLLFLGIMLSATFLLAAVVIIYYKQISEGYEDQARFDVMQKVGMTRRDIRRSINSQVFIVFFSPLLLAGMHLAFAFPFLWRILMVFSLNNVRFVIIVALICFAVFGLLYALVYKLTSSAYYQIVSGGQETY